MKKLILLASILGLLSGCITESEPIETTNSQANLMQSGDIVIVNTATDSVLLLDSSGTYKSTLYSGLTNAAITITALNWDHLNNKLLIMYDHTTATSDSILQIDPYDLSVSIAYQNSTILTATGLNGVARLTSGDLVAIESTATLEKFSSSWTRQGAPFMATLVATAVDIDRAGDGFVVCSNAVANTIRTYTAAGATVATATSALPLPSLGAAVASSGCKQKTNGKIVVAFNGATDGVRQYSSDLGTVDFNFINATVLSSPGKIAVRENGNILVPDTVLNHIVEIDNSGQLVKTFAGSILSTPGSILVVP